MNGGLGPCRLPLRKVEPDRPSEPLYVADVPEAIQGLGFRHTQGAFRTTRLICSLPVTVLVAMTTLQSRARACILARKPMRIDAGSAQLIGAMKLRDLVKGISA
jgi:hypothetical protein